jgi:NtrC-family two-component system sensor histidine kinase KinB
MKSIRARIAGTFAALVVINLGASFWSIYNFYAMGTTVATMLRENYRSILATENMVKALERQDNALLTASEGEEVSLSGSFGENKELFFYWEEQATRSISVPLQASTLDSIRGVYRQYLALADLMQARILQGAFEDAIQYYYTNIRPTSDRLRELCFTLFEINQTAMHNAETRTHTIANQTAYGTMITSIVTLILSVGAALWLIKVLIKPAEQLTQTVSKIGKGKLDLKIDVLSDDEIGQLSREFNKMTERLRRFELMNIEQIISEKRKSEAIVESISDALIVTDANLGILHLNKAAADLLNIRVDEAVRKKASEVVTDERILALIRDAAGADHNRDSRGANGRVNDRDFTYLHVEHGGRDYYFRPKTTRIFDNEGRLYGIVTLLQDVTQFKELDRMKSDFIATLSHEFKTPLTSINMSIDILKQGILGDLNQRQKELIESTKEDSMRLTKLAKELLQLSKLESGKLQFRNVELSIRSVIEFSVRPLSLQFQEKGVALELDVPDGLPPLIADEQQISWVITNLVTNALKYTDGGGRVTIRARAEHASVVVSVEDTGQGIAPEHLNDIFDKFVQVQRTSDYTPGSVGLGLAIAKEIVDAYGGRIWVESQQGKGSTFTFVLPLASTATASHA